MTLRCEYSPNGRFVCRTPLVERIDQLGRLTFDCPSCERRRHGYCRTCPQQMPENSRAEFCEECRVRRLRSRHNAYRERHPERALKLSRLALRRRRGRAGKPPMTPQESGALGGRSGGPARARSLTPERRSEIARMGAAATNAKRRRGDAT